MLDTKSGGGVLENDRISEKSCDADAATDYDYQQTLHDVDDITFHPASDIPIIPGDLPDEEQRTAVFGIGLGSSLSINSLAPSSCQINQYLAGSSPSAHQPEPGKSPARSSFRNKGAGHGGGWTRNGTARSFRDEYGAAGERASIVSFQASKKNLSVKDPAVTVDGDDEYELVCPDGGWGWAVLFGATLVNVLIPGMIKSFGVLFVEFLDVFKSSPSAASWIPALSYWLYCFCAPFASVLCIRFSHRAVTFVGGFLAAFGLVLSYFANSIPYLYVSYGLIGGLGAGLGFPPGVFLVGSYFQKRRGLANGIVQSGSAMGGVIMPPLLRYLINEYNYRGAILILGALLLNVWVGAMFYEPVEMHMKRVPKKQPDAVVSVTVKKGDAAAAAGEEDVLLLGPGAKSQAISNNLTRNVSFAGSRRTSFSSYVSQSIPVPSKDAKASGGGGSGAKKPLPDSISELPQQLDGSLPKSYSFTDPEVDEEQLQCLQQRNLHVIPEHIRLAELRNADWNYYESLPAAKQKLLRMTMNAGEERLLRSASVASNVSSSFHYIHTIHHGSMLNVFPNAKAPEFASTLTLKSVKNSFIDCPLVDWIKRCFAFRNKHPASLKPKKPRKASEMDKYFDFALLKDGVYLIMLLSTSTTAIGLTNFTILLPTYATQLGFDKSQGSLLLSIFAALDFVGRIGGAALSDLGFIPRKYYYNVALLSSGVLLCFLPLAGGSYWAFSTGCSLFGLASGIYIGITTAILADQLGPEKLGSSYGISLFVSGMLQLIGPPICGLFLETWKSFAPLIMVLGAILVVGGASTFFIPLIEARRLREKTKELDENHV